MPSAQTITRIIIIGFMVGVGYALAKAFYYGSFIGILLAAVSLCAGIYFLYTMAKAKREMEIEMERENAA